MPILLFFKSLGESVKRRLIRKGKDTSNIMQTVDSFYTLYLISSGTVSDKSEVVELLKAPEWSELPLQIHIIALESNEDNQELHKDLIHINKSHSKWPQFHLYFFDKMKQFYHERAIDKLRHDSVLIIPRDIESYLFINQLDLQAYRHNKSLQNAT
jgi:hypothetical protein